MMDPVDLDWQTTCTWPGDPTITGYVPPVGEHILCRRPADGAVRCGTVDDNRAGLFLTLCGGGRAVLTAANWTAHPTPAHAHPANGDPTQCALTASRPSPSTS